MLPLSFRHTPVTTMRRLLVAVFENADVGAALWAWHKAAGTYDAHAHAHADGLNEAGCQLVDELSKHALALAALVLGQHLKVNPHGKLPDSTMSAGVDTVLKWSYKPALNDAEATVVNAGTVDAGCQAEEAEEATDPDATDASAPAQLQAHAVPASKGPTDTALTTAEHVIASTATSTATAEDEVVQPAKVVVVTWADDTEICEKVRTGVERERERERKDKARER